MTVPRKARDRRVQRVIDIIEMDQRVPVAELARQVDLSSSRLEHLFKEEVGRSITNYMLETKLRAGAYLLMTTDLQIKEISSRVGYEHPPSFVRAFKAQYRITPSSFRRDPEQVGIHLA